MWSGIGAAAATADAAAAAIAAAADDNDNGDNNDDDGGNICDEGVNVDACYLVWHKLQTWLTSEKALWCSSILKNTITNLAHTYWKILSYHT